jgi:hypothetical protein
MNTQQKLTRQELLQLVGRIMAADGTEQELNEMVALFDHNCVNPKKNGLIFWPHGFPHDPTKRNPTAGEIVDAALDPTSSL